jgi:hypothetical protein
MDSVSKPRIFISNIEADLFNPDNLTNATLDRETLVLTTKDQPYVDYVASLLDNHTLYQESEKEQRFPQPKPKPLYFGITEENKKPEVLKVNVSDFAFTDGANNTRTLSFKLIK